MTAQTGQGQEEFMDCHVLTNSFRSPGAENTHVVDTEQLGRLPLFHIGPSRRIAQVQQRDRHDRENGDHGFQAVDVGIFRPGPELRVVDPLVILRGGADG